MGVLPPKYVNMVRDRVAAVRETCGPDVDIIMENHCGTDTQSAMQLAQAVELENIQTNLLDNDVMITGRVRRPECE